MGYDYFKSSIRKDKMTRTAQIDLLNIGLIIVAFGLAILLPFRLFLFGYAILGPLHYLTEINWLHGKQYFVSSNRWLLIGCVVSFIVVIPKLIQFLGLLEIPAISTAATGVDGISNAAVFLALWSGASIVFLKGRRLQLVSLLVGIFLAYLLNSVPLYVVWVGLMIPTVVHVYLFTGLFMLYGAIRSGSTWGFISVAILCLIPLATAFIQITPGFYNFTDEVKNTFIDNRFHIINLELAKFFGIADGRSFLFYGAWELKIQTFIAFAYIYHYLNWFSKTAIIGWHKGLEGKRAFAIIALWLSLAAFFCFDYRLGFYATLGLSFLHVILEFPLNILSIRGIGGRVMEKYRRQISSSD